MTLNRFSHFSDTEMTESILTQNTQTLNQGNESGGTSTNKNAGIPQNLSQTSIAQYLASESNANVKTLISEFAR